MSLPLSNRWIEEIIRVGKLLTTKSGGQITEEMWRTADSAPRESRRFILCYCAHSDGFFIAHWNSGDFWEQRTGKTAPEFTHWMDLPAKPSAPSHEDKR